MTSNPTTTSSRTDASHPGSKLELMLALLQRPSGASLAQLTEATGWQAHSVRGAIAGSLSKKGHKIISEKVDSLRRYRLEAAVETLP